jgi:hypothetical protein
MNKWTRTYRALRVPRVSKQIAIFHYNRPVLKFMGSLSFYLSLSLSIFFSFSLTLSPFNRRKKCEIIELPPRCVHHARDVVFKRARCIYTYVTRIIKILSRTAKNADWMIERRGWKPLCRTDASTLTCVCVCVRIYNIHNNVYTLFTP